MVEDGPTEDELAKAKAYLKGSYALELRHLDQDRRQLLQIQLDDLGIDYIDKRNGMIDAVTHRGRQAGRQAAARRRHAGHRGRPAARTWPPRNRGG